ncbi:MAG: right-handed parallel beta-helix repeat-containing protein [Myxococcota bacterium]
MPKLRSSSPGFTCGALGCPTAAIAVAVLVVGAAFPVHADTLSVPGDFASIQSAVDAAADGDRIEVDDGVYAESVRIERRAGLDLIAVGAAVIDAAGLEVGVLVRKSSDVRVKGFKILNANEDGVRVAGSSDVAVARNRIDFVGDDCIELDRTLDETPTRHVRVDGNTLKNCGSHGIEVDASDVRIEDNRINRTGSDGIELSRGLDQEVLRNTVLRAGDDGIEVQTRKVLLRRNRVSRSRDDGFHLDGNRNRLVRNISVRSRMCAVNDQGRWNRLVGNRLEDGNTLFCNERNNDD